MYGFMIFENLLALVLSAGHLHSSFSIVDDGSLCMVPFFLLCRRLFFVKLGRILLIATLITFGVRSYMRNFDW